MSELTANDNTKGSLIESFSLTQISRRYSSIINDNALLELLVCSFFFGAERKLRKQSDLNEAQSHHLFVPVIMSSCKMSEFKASTLIESIDHLAEKYYIVESMMEEGEKAAEQWLDCEEEPTNHLHPIIDKYKDMTLFDLGIEGLNALYLKKQQRLYTKTDAMIKHIRFRTMYILFFFVSVSSLLVYYFLKRL